MSLKVGDTIPQGSFKYIPYTPDLEDNVSPFKNPNITVSDSIKTQNCSLLVVFVRGGSDHHRLEA